MSHVFIPETMGRIALYWYWVPKTDRHDPNVEEYHVDQAAIVGWQIHPECPTWPEPVCWGEPFECCALLMPDGRVFNDTDNVVYASLDEWTQDKVRFARSAESMGA